MYLQNILLCLTATLVLSTCNRVYVHPFNLFAYTKSECECIQVKNYTFQKQVFTDPIEGKVNIQLGRYHVGSSGTFLTSLINVLGFRVFQALVEIHTSNTILLASTNFYWSMLSIYLGASEQTAMNLQALLGFEHSSKSRSCTSQVNGLKVISKLETIDYVLFAKNGNISMSKAVCIFVSPNVRISENFIEDLIPSADNVYIRAVNFTNSARAVNLINEFFDSRLQLKTKFGPTSIDEASNFMYISHVTYKGTVTNSFLIPELQQFFIEPNRPISVPMISASGIFQFKDDNKHNLLIVKIYLGEKNFILLIMPTNGNTVKNIESSITGIELLTGLSNRSIHLTVPKLETEFSYDAKDLLAYMKMPTLLGKDAHFGKLSNEDIKIGKIINLVHFQLKDSGNSKADSVPENNEEQEPLELKFDKPFILALFEGTTKALILLARIVNPLNIM